MRRRVQLRAGLLLLGGLIVIGAGGTARAGDVDVRGGYYADTEAGFVGGGWLGQFNPDRAWYFNPNAEFAFSGDMDRITLNGDVHYDFPSDHRVAYWVGGGPAVLRNHPDVGDDDTDLGLNLLAGLGFKQGSVRPFLQGKLTLSDDSEAVVALGIRF
ncbi:MAG TPA: hypothetical protein VJS92_11095 [Candidatus Polarisedimenticolaceae bacterium]|nr:hypothetical protein [Candidatus Polarisedimenticolaceae bacterium]